MDKLSLRYMNYPMIPPSMKAPPHLQTTCRWESTDFLWKREVSGSKNLPGGVAFIQNGHGFANVARQSLSLLCHYLHKKHDYFVTCCFHAIHDLQTASLYYHTVHTVHTSVWVYANIFPIQTLSASWGAAWVHLMPVRLGTTRRRAWRSRNNILTIENMLRWRC